MGLASITFESTLNSRVIFSVDYSRILVGTNSRIINHRFKNISFFISKLHYNYPLLFQSAKSFAFEGGNKWEIQCKNILGIGR